MFERVPSSLVRLGAALLFSPLLCATQHATASQDERFPTRPITIVVPFPPGGVTDQVARVFGDKLQQRLGQPVIVENRPGAATSIGTTQVARAKPDGYTLIIATPPLVIAPHLMVGRVPFTHKEFEPVTQVLALQNAVMVRADSEFKTARDLIDFARMNPGKVSYGAAGTGTGNHLAAVLFQRVNNIDMTFIPYKGGAPVRQDLLAGVIPVMSAPVGENAELIRAGRIRILAIVSQKPSPIFPNAPTMVQLGFPEVDASGWIGIAVPKGTPSSIVDLLATEFQTIGKLSEVASKFEAIGYEMVLSSPAQFGSKWLSEDRKWGTLIRESNIKIDE
jgi:tripartite-type tricarboxylate transporter receptor subunit TctC